MRSSQLSFTHVAGLFVCLFFVGCARRQVEEPSKPDRVGDLRREINELASPRGCKAASECRIADVGYNSCGGPRVHLVYCGTSTDAEKLSQKLAELESAEEERGDPVDSKCIKPKRPDVELVNDLCRAKLLAAWELASPPELPY